MSKIKTSRNQKRIPLGHLLRDVLPFLSHEAIRAARYRARRAGRMDPYPFVVRETGVPYPLADLPEYNAQALRKGWPLVQINEIEGGGAL